MFSAMVWTCSAVTGSATAGASLAASLPQADSATASSAPSTASFTWRLMVLSFPHSCFILWAGPHRGEGE